MQPANRRSCPVTSSDVLPLLDHRLLDLAGIYGDPNAGDPLQYDGLRIEHDQGAVEIVVYNRAVLLLRTDSQGASDLHRNSHAARLILCGNEVVLARSVELK